MCLYKKLPVVSSSDMLWTSLDGWRYIFGSFLSFTLQMWTLISNGNDKIIDKINLMICSVMLHWSIKINAQALNR